MTGLLLACSGFAFYAGIGAHSNRFDHEDWRAENPIGLFGVDYEYQLTDRWSLRGNIEHNSSIGIKDSPAYNLINGQILFRLP